jgi:hypothetical protein
VTATSAAAAQTVLTGASVAYDGSTVVRIEFYCSFMEPGTSAFLLVNLWEDSTDIGRLCYMRSPDSASNFGSTGYGVLRRTPSNASHTYTAKAWNVTANGTLHAGTPGTDAILPMFLRVTKV